jgi:hypothetical protein
MNVFLYEDIGVPDDRLMAGQEVRSGRLDREAEMRIDAQRQFVFVQDMDATLINEDIHGKVAPDELLRREGHLVGDIEVIDGRCQIPALPDIQGIGTVLPVEGDGLITGREFDAMDIILAVDDVPKDAETGLVMKQLAAVALCFA